MSNSPEFDNIILVMVINNCNTFLPDVLRFCHLLLLLHHEAFLDQSVDIFPYAPLLLEPVVHLGRRASDEGCNVCLDFLNHA
jgi:hypothetical protein